MFWKRFIQDYLTFSKKERVAIIAVLLVVLGIYFLPRLFKRPATPLVARNDLIASSTLDSLEQRKNDEHFSRDENYNEFSSNFEPKKHPPFEKGELFQFNPNTLTADGWLRLGLNEKTTKTILNYRSKGGKFYKAEDLMRIWGMPEGFYDRVKDYVDITSVEKRSYTENNFTPYEKTEKKPTLVNINDADTTAFIALPGIGSKLASRIIGFRDKLGGFYSVDQVAETYGLPDSTFHKIKPRLQVNQGTIRKFNINTATKEELKMHPYIKWNLANAIVEYRNQHGAYKTLEDLKNIAVIDEVTFNKIVHYLSL